MRSARRLTRAALAIGRIHAEVEVALEDLDTPAVNIEAAATTLPDLAPGVVPTA